MQWHTAERRRAECFAQDNGGPLGSPERTRDCVRLACCLGRINHAG